MLFSGWQIADGPRSEGCASRVTGRCPKQAFGYRFVTAGGPGPRAALDRPPPRRAAWSRRLRLATDMNQQDTSLAEWLAAADGSLGLVFSDIVGSTHLLYSARTLDYVSMLRAHKQRAVALSEKNGGRLIGETGDELLAAFAWAAQAFAFAEALFGDPGHAQLRVRVGVHYGRVRAEGDGLAGRNVHLGARVMQHGVESELWLSDAAKAALEEESPALGARIAWIAHDECELKGVPGRQRLWRAA
jgi:class 3 adenylate cyclase